MYTAIHLVYGETQMSKPKYYQYEQMKMSRQKYIFCNINKCGGNEIRKQRALRYLNGTPAMIADNSQLNHRITVRGQLLVGLITFEFHI